MSIPQPTVIEGDLIVKTNTQPAIHGYGDVEVGRDLLVRRNLTVEGDFSRHDVTTIVTTDGIMGLGDSPTTAGYDKGLNMERHPIDIVSGPVYQEDTAQAGAASTITLATGANPNDDFYNTMYVKITGGTGLFNEYRQISDYVGATRVATVDAPWTTAPDNTTTYAIYAATHKTIIWDESEKEFAMAATTDDHDANVVTIHQYCDLRVRSILQSIPQQCIYYVGMHGDNTNSGFHINEAFLTFSHALATAAALPPDATHQVSIVCLDACKYTENLTIPQYVHVFAASATLCGEITLNNDSSVNFRQLELSSGQAVSKTTPNGSASATIGVMKLTSTADGVYNAGTGSQLKFHNTLMEVEDGIGVENNATGNGFLNVNMCDIMLTGTGTAILNSNITPINAIVQQITEDAFGSGTALDAQAGTINGLVNKIDTDVACEIAAGATINLYIDEISGTENVAVGGTANKLPAVEVRNHIDDVTSNPHNVTINQANTQENLLTTKGDIFVFNGTSVVRLPVGIDGSSLVADSLTPEGIKWSISGGSGSTLVEYPLTVNKVTVNNLTWVCAGKMTWLNSRYNTYTQGIVIFHVDIINRDLDIRLRDVTNATTLGSSLAINSSGYYTFNVSNPISDAELELQVQKSAAGGVSPLINSSVVEFTS